MRTSDNLVMGIIAGAAIGTLIGMLISPHSGALNRRIIRRKGENIADEVTEAITAPIEEFYEAITEKIDMLKKDVLAKIGC